MASDTLERNSTRVKIVAFGNGTAYVSGMTGLYFLWYRDYPMENFHFFNDNAEWGQMDKVGHVASCYMEGLAGINMMRWAGFSEKQSVWYGGSYGLLWQGAVEIMDGFSSGWGFSGGDMLANLVGSGLAIGQELGWKEQRVQMKFSFYPTKYAQYRPNVLGDGLVQEMLKDYNGQTYWLSFNMASFAHESTNIPKWLNLAVGYGIDGFIGARSNMVGTDEGSDYSHIDRCREFYLSPDIDFTKIETNKTWAKVALHVLNSIKMPAPALKYQTNTNSWHFIPFHF